MSAPLKTFIIYARDDDAYKSQLLLHLRPLVVSGLLTVWHDGNILPGEDWEKAIKKELKASQLVILLVSVHSLNSEFIQTEELRTALDGLDAGLTRVVPVVVSPCVWKFDPVIRRLQALPLSGSDGVLPVSEWKNSNLAWSKVVEEIGDMVVELNEKRIEQERLELERLQQQQQAEEQTRLAAERAAAAQLQLEQERLQQQQEDQKRAQEESARAAAEQARQALQARIAADKHAEQQRISAEQAQRKAAERLERQAKSGNFPQQKVLYASIAIVGIILLALWISSRKPPVPDNRTGNNPNTPPESTQTQEDLPGKAWKNAFDTGTIPALRNFQDKYPNSKYAGDARTAIAKLDNDVKELLKAADLFASENLKKDAIKKLRDAETINPNDPEIQRRLKKMGVSTKE